MVAARTLSSEPASSVRTDLGAVARHHTVRREHRHRGLQRLDVHRHRRRRGTPWASSPRSPAGCAPASSRASARSRARGRPAVSRLARIQSPLAVQHRAPGRCRCRSASLTPAAVRMSASTRTAGFRRARCVNDGSAIMPPSTRAVLDARPPRSRRVPIDVTLTASARRPWRCEDVGQQHLRRRAGARDADDAPLEIFDASSPSRRSAARWRAPSRESQHRDERHELAPLGGHLNRVIVEAGHDVGAAADQRPAAPSRRRRSPRSSTSMPLLAVVTQLLRQRRRQIDHLALAADGDPDMRAGAVMARAPVSRRPVRTPGTPGQRASCCGPLLQIGEKPLRRARDLVGRRALAVRAVAALGEDLEARDAGERGAQASSSPGSVRGSRAP